MSDMLAWLAEPLQYAFMVRGLLAALIVGIVCPVLGAYVVLRGMAFFGDALAHIVLPGVVVAYLAGWPLVLGALLAGVIGGVRLSQSEVCRTSELYLPSRGSRRGRGVSDPQQCFR